MLDEVRVLQVGQVTGDLKVLDEEEDNGVAREGVGSRRAARVVESPSLEPVLDEED